MRFWDIMAWVVVVLGTLATIYTASGIILLTINSMSHVRWLLLVPIVAVLVIDQVLSHQDRHRAPAEPS